MRRLSVIGKWEAQDRIDLVQEETVCLLDAFCRGIALWNFARQHLRIASKLGVECSRRGAVRKPGAY